MQTPINININGVITAPQDAKISVLDHGLLFGDSVYESLRTYGGKPFLFSRHFARLQHSADAINLKLPWSKSKTLEEIRKTCLPGECRIRLIVTRGIGDVSATTETCVGPTVIIIVVPLAAPDEKIYTEGVEVVISSIKRSGRLADIKTGSLIHQVMARQEADSKNAYEAVLLTADEKLSDGITSNIYLVQDRKILTPSHDAGIVEGITRGVVLTLAREMGLEVVEGFFDVGEVARAHEMFLTSSTREVVPITRANGSTIGVGKPGPVTLMLLKAYQSALAQLTLED
jgi:branched-chain amino acid aminotransferase